MKGKDGIALGDVVGQHLIMNPIDRLAALFQCEQSVEHVFLNFFWDPRLLPLRAEPYGRQNTAQ